MRTSAKNVVTPFHWQRHAVAGADIGRPEGSRRRAASAAAAKKLTAQERVALILADRWGNPYCKPGAT